MMMSADKPPLDEMLLQLPDVARYHRLPKRMEEDYKVWTPIEVEHKNSFLKDTRKVVRYGKIDKEDQVRIVE